MNLRNEAAPVLIAGGGIGGLATALGLARKGVRSVVFEKAPVLGEIGAGIQLGPNAFHAFDYLGVGDEARAAAVFIDSLRLMDAMTSDEITHIPVGDDFRRRFKNPYAVMHRGDLLRVLLDACTKSAHIRLRTHADVAGYTQDGSAVVVTLASGESVAGCALIGADGLWSKVRERVVGDGDPRVSGHTAYRSVIPADAMPEALRWNAATLWAGPGCHIVHYPLSGWKYFNLVATCDNGASTLVAGQPVPGEEVLQAFQHVHDRARSIIRHGSAWKSWVLCDRAPTARWADGRVVLLGDAAHPMLQYFAQGACMALEDAVCLSHVLGITGDVERAFEEYQTRRLVRTARVQLQSRAIGEHIYHPAGVHASVRDSIMTRMSAEDWYDSVEWLYGGSGLHAREIAVTSVATPDGVPS